MTFAAAVLACLALFQQKATELEVWATVSPQSPLLGEPVRLYTVVKNLGTAPVVLVAGLKLTAPDVFIAEVGGEGELKFERLDRGPEPSGSDYKLTLTHDEVFSRQDHLNEDGRSGGFAFPKAGTSQVKVMFQGAESKPVQVVVKEPEAKEQEALKAIQDGGLHRFWGLLPRTEDYKPEIAAGLAAFLKKFPASKYRRFVAFAQADYWRRFDTQLAGKEYPEAASQRRYRMLELFTEASRNPPFTTEGKIGRGIALRLQGRAREASSILSSALKEKTAAPWFALVGAGELQAADRKRSE